MEQKTADLFKKLLGQLKPPPDISLSQWADRYRFLSSEAAAEPGHWRTSRAPYQREIMDAVTDRKTRKVVVMSASQMGKTDSCILNPVGYYVHYDPAPIMVMEPTLQMSEDLSKDRISTMIRDTPVLKERIDDRSRTSGNTIMHKVFPGGHITLVGANSPASLASRPIRILLADELDRYPPSAGKEGDPLFLAEQRTKTFWNRKTVVTSTPTIKGASRIETEYENSTMEVWTVPCPECGAYQTFEWNKIIFDSKNFMSGARDVSMVCEACGAVSSETAWKNQSKKGKYEAQHPERETRGFLITGLASTFNSWADIVQKFLEANEEKKKGNLEPLKSWTNTEMGQTWEEEGETVEFGDLLDRTEDYIAEAPEGVLFITCGVDVQDDRFEFEFVGWGAGKESWGLGYNVLYGDLKQKDIWDSLDKHIMKTFRKSDGTVLNVGCTCIDTGGHFYVEVCRFVKDKEHRHVYAIRGISGFDKPFIGRPATGNRYRVKMFNIGVDTGKSLVMDRLMVKHPGPGYCHFPKEESLSYNEYYFKMLTAEKRILTYRKGQAMYTWDLRNKGFRRNEALDIRDYATAALEIANPALDEEDKLRRRKVKAARRQRTNGI
jgi:phage terminase large subunit GpA-like protein